MIENVRLPLPDRAADMVAKFGGSWTFIFIFLIFCMTWIVINLCVYSFDSFPFILLNLFLSCLAVFQAPFILMSQNRMSDIDRQQARDDFEIDFKAEAEIRELHEKVDYLIKLVALKS